MSVPVACRRLLRGADCSVSAVDLADLGAKKDYEEMQAKKWRLGTDEDALFLRSRLNVQAKFPEQNRAQAGPLTCTGYIAMRSLPDGSILGLLQKPVPRQILLLGLLVIPGAARGTRFLQFDKKSGAYHTSFNHQRSTKSPSQTQKCM